MMMKTVLLGLWWVLAVKQCAGQIEIISVPPNMTVALNRAEPLELMFCARTTGEIFIDINDIPVDSVSIPQLKDRGIIVGDTITDSLMKLSLTVTIKNFSIESNNTKITWHAHENGFSISNCTVITIVGYPTVPNLQLDASDENVLHLTWEEPFAFDAFPILKYYASVLDINGIVLSHAVLNPDTRAFNFTAMGPETACTELTFRVIAENGVGNSSAAIVHGAFPSLPGLFMELPNVTVYFPQDESLVKIAVNFTIPVCPYNNTTYVIVIADAEGGDVVYVRRPTELNCSSVHVEITDARLQLYRDYILNVTVSTTLGCSTSTTTFNTILATTTGDTTVPVGAGIVRIAAISVGSAVGAMVGLIVVTLCTIYLCRRYRKRTRECINATEINQISHTANFDKNGLPMVVNPIYEKEAIYEEIPNSHFTRQEESYVPVTSPGNSHPLPEKCSLHGHEDTYTRMDPAGTLHGQLSMSAVGAAAVGGSPEGRMQCRDEEGASAQCGQQLNQENRYITFS